MKAKGAAVDPENRGTIIGWLAAKSAFDVKCSACHGTDRPLGKSKSRADWTATVQRMGAKKPGHLSEARRRRSPRTSRSSARRRRLPLRSRACGRPGRPLKPGP